MKKLLFLTLAMAFFQTAFSQEEVLYRENFESGYLQSNTVKTSTGKFKENAGIKSCVNIAGNKAFGFGRSNCNVGCDRNTTTLKITFDNPSYVYKIEFKDIEKYGNWGSNGAVFIDGKIDNSSFFGRNPANDKKMDNAYRNHTVTVNKKVKTIEFKVIAITSKSEIFIDDVVVYGYDPIKREQKIIAEKKRLKELEYKKRQEEFKRKLYIKTKLITINGNIILGKTDYLEAKKLGYLVGRDARYHNFIKFNNMLIYTFFSPSTFDELILKRKGYMPSSWRELGFSWNLSYNEWISILKKYGFSIKEFDSDMAIYNKQLYTDFEKIHINLYFDKKNTLKYIVMTVYFE